MKSFQTTLLLAIGMMVSNSSYSQRTLENPCNEGEILAWDTTAIQSRETISINVRKTTWWNERCELRTGKDEDKLFQEKVVRYFVCKDTTKSKFTDKGVPPMLPPAVSNCTTIVNCPAPLTQTTCCPADSAYAQNAIGPLLKYTYNNGFKFGVIYKTSNRFAKKADSKQSYWTEKFVQVDGYLSITAGLVGKKKSVSCDTCFGLVQITKELDLEVEPGAKLRLGNHGALLHPFIGAAVPIKWSKSHEWDIVPLAEAGVLMGMKNSFPKNKGLLLGVSGTYSKYGFGARFSLAYFFGIGNKSKEKAQQQPPPVQKTSNLKS